MATDQAMGAMPHPGMEVFTAEGESVGTVKEMQGRYFKVDAPMKPDFWLTADCIRRTNANTVTLRVDKDHLGDVKTDRPSQREAQSLYQATTTDPNISTSRTAGADIGRPLGNHAQRGATSAQGQGPSGGMSEPVGAIALLMQMHREAKTPFRQILDSGSGGQAAMRWNTLEPTLKLHEEMEEQHLYNPLKQEQGRGSEPGDWEPRHEREVQELSAMIAQADNLSPTDERWLPQIRRINDALARHIDEEETTIFPRIQQVWDRERLERAGQQMQAMKQQRLGRTS